MREEYDMKTLPMARVLRRPLWGRLRPPLLCSLVPRAFVRRVVNEDREPGAVSSGGAHVIASEIARRDVGLGRCSQR